MRYEVPVKLGSLELSSAEILVLAALVPVAAALMIGVRRDAAVFVGVVSMLAVLVAK
ncbi:hypothetical protein KHP62_04885 [Rhodobacteraceae bacterium NNCM2]|nr:hypothetical protein [Coraliihabitans acroporae]